MLLRPMNIAAIILGAGLMFSCSKSGSGGNGGTVDGTHVFNPSDITPPVLVINSPVANEIFLNGNSIVVTGKITDTQGLYQGSIRVVNDANGALLKEQLYEIHGVLSYNFNSAYVVNTVTAGIYTVTVSFNDHGLNTVTQSVKVQVGP